MALCVDHSVQFKTKSGDLALLSIHAHVLCLLLTDRGCRQHELARKLGITTRTASRVIRDLCNAGYITAVRGSARRNFYTVCVECGLRHPLERGRTVGELLRDFKVDHERTPGAR